MQGMHNAGKMMLHRGLGLGRAMAARRLWRCSGCHARVLHILVA